jgi:hypothetical protein
VPFAKRLARIVKRLPSSSGTHSSPIGQGPPLRQQQTNTDTQSASTPQSSGNANQGNGTSSSGLQPNRQLPHHISTTVTNANPATLPALHVFFVVATSETHQLAQMDVQKLTDDKFFQLLKSEYFRLRGFLRKWMGIWRFSHCLFYKVRQITFLPEENATKFCTLV